MGYSKNKSYKLPQANFPLEMCENVSPAPRWSSTGTSAQSGKLPSLEMFLSPQVSVRAIWQSFRVCALWTGGWTTDPRVSLPLESFCEHDSSHRFKRNGKGFLQHPWAPGPASETEWTTHAWKGGKENKLHSTRMVLSITPQQPLAELCPKHFSRSEHKRVREACWL